MSTGAETEGSPTETSPLLANPDGVAPQTLNRTSAVSQETIAYEGGNNGDSGSDAREAGDESEDGHTKPSQVTTELRQQMRFIFPAMTIGVFMAAADQTIVGTSYGRIGSDLTALNKTSWIATAYFLSLTCFQPLYGKLSDIFSRKPCLIFAYLIFGAGCLFCGLAQDIDQLIIARTLQGIGGGGMSTVTSIILSDAVPLKERGKWQGYVNIIYAFGAASGAPLGGLLTDTIGWRWAFLGQAPLCVAAMLAVGFAMHLPKPEGESLNWKLKLKRIDFLGATCLISAVFAFILGMDRGSNVSWLDKTSLIPLCLSLPLFILFMYVEINVASEPFAPGRIIFERSLFAAYLCNFFSFAGVLAGLFYVPLHFQAVYGMSASQAGILMIPSTLTGVLGSLFAGFYMQKTNRYYWLTVISYTNLIIGMTILTVCAGLGQKYNWAMITGMCISSFSNGTGVTTTLIALIANSAREDQAVVTACSYLFRSLGGTLGISLSATVANSTLRKLLQAALKDGADADEIAEGVRQSLRYLDTLKPAVRDVVRRCYSGSTRSAFVLEIGLVVGAAISAWFLREKSLNR